MPRRYSHVSSIDCIQCLFLSLPRFSELPTSPVGGVEIEAHNPSLIIGGETQIILGQCFVTVVQHGRLHRIVQTRYCEVPCAADDYSPCHGHESRRSSDSDSPHLPQRRALLELRCVVGDFLLRSVAQILDQLNSLWHDSHFETDTCALPRQWGVLLLFLGIQVVARWEKSAPGPGLVTSEFNLCR
jgi:hypothetical protein